ncbi:hypothetical protein EYS14_19200 [Alteromonadaceae bacterium M269]|nr:hypothetical protein EYS14_19200 [Alteromonadaceae bacterium M269]
MKKRVLRLVDQQHDCSAKPSNSLVSTLVAGFTGIGLVLVFVAAPHMATAELAPDAQFEPSIIESGEDTPNTRSDGEALTSNAIAEIGNGDSTLLSFENSDVFEEVESASEIIVQEDEVSNYAQELPDTQGNEVFDDAIDSQDSVAVLPPLDSIEKASQKTP